MPRSFFHRVAALRRNEGATNPAPLADLCDDPRPACLGDQVRPDITDIVPDDLLRRLAMGWPEAAVGEIPADLQAEIAMVLPDIAAEAMAARLIARARAAGRIS